MDLFTLATFTIAYAIAVLVPGPGVAAVVARALGGGFKGALPMVLSAELHKAAVPVAAVTLKTKVKHLTRLRKYLGRNFSTSS